MTNTTATVAPEHNIVAMKAQFDDFTARGNKAGETLQAAIPLTGRPLPAQEAFLFALADIKLLQHLMETVQNTFNGINLQAATPEQLAEGGDFAQSLAELAGEMSGHMFFADRYHGYDDALYAACRLIEIVADSGRPLSTLLADLPRTVTTPEIRFDCPDEIKFEVVRLASAELRARHKTVDVDGVRVLFAEGWGLVRASNTQPVLVMRFEATTPELLAQYQREVESVVERSKRQAQLTASHQPPA